MFQYDDKFVLVPNGRVEEREIRCRVLLNNGRNFIGVIKPVVERSGQMVPGIVTGKQTYHHIETREISLQ